VRRDLDELSVDPLAGRALSRARPGHSVHVGVHASLPVSVCRGRASPAPVGGAAAPAALCLLVVLVLVLVLVLVVLRLVLVGALLVLFLFVVVAREEARERVLGALERALRLVLRATLLGVA